MSTSLQSFLRSYAIESGAIASEEIGAEEIVVVTDETVTELEQEIEDIAAKSEKVSDDVDALVEASDAVVAVEGLLIDRINYLSVESNQRHYNRHVQAMSWAGVIDSMEAYKFPQEMIQEIVSDISFEAEEGEGGNEEQAKKDAEKKGGVLAKVIEFFKRILEAAKNLWARFVSLFRKSSGNNKRLANILRSAIEERNGDLAKDATISGGKWANLTFDGTIDAVKAVEAVNSGWKQHVKGLGVTTLGALNKLADAVAKESDGGIFNKLRDTLGAKGPSVAAAKVLASLVPTAPSAFSFTLGGGRECSFSTAVGGTGARTGGAFAIVNPTNKVEVKETAVPSRDELKKLVAAIDESNRLYDENVEQISKLQADIATSEKAIGVRMENLRKGAKTAEAADSFQRASQAVNIVLGLSKQFLPAYAKLSLANTHLAYQFGMTAISKYGKKAAE